MVLAQAAVFAWVWYSVYRGQIDEPFWRKGNWVLIAIYGLMFALFAKLYGGLKVGYLKRIDVFYSLTLALLCTNVVEYLEITLINRWFLSVWPMIEMTGIQLVLIIIWIFGSRYIYSGLYRARRLMVIYGDRDPGDDLIHKMNSRKDKYDISGKVHISVGEEKIHQMMQDYDGVIIWDLHSTERNRYLKYCFAHSVRCYVSPKISDIILMGSERIHLFDTPLLVSRNMGLAVDQRAAKRVMDILEYRQLSKLKSTYADGLVGEIAEDGRIHSTFNQTITATGRISSTEPNLQNIPVRMELGRLIRKVFVPEEGYVFLDADYSQIELRVLAHMSGDEKLIQAYKEAQDIHRHTASEVFHVPFDEVTDLQRRNAKAVNFGIVYGISSFGLSQDLSITRKEAAEYIERYFETYPKIKGFLDGLVEEGKEKGYVTTMFGRRRPIPELKSGNFMQRSFGERVAMNSPIQGTAADIIKIAMNRVYRRLKDENLKSRLVLQVHDELLIETCKEEIPQVSAILEEEMKGAAKLSVELEVDMHQGNNWYEAK